MAGRELAKTTPRIELVEVTEADRTVLDQLAQLYEYDFSEFTHSDVGADGRFREIDLGTFFTKSERHAFVIRVDDEIGGFALVCADDAFRDPSERIWWMQEFFVLRSYRRQGVGGRVATELFDRFGETWEVGQMAENTQAQAFWRTVIGSYTGGDFEEFDQHDENWHGPVQYFHASQARKNS